MAVQPLKSPWSGTSLLVLVVLCLENSASMLVRRYAVGIAHIGFSKNAVLMANELIKLAFSLYMIRRAQPASRFQAHIRTTVQRAHVMFVPALIYLAINVISYPALARIPATVFTAISQLKVLTTALFAILLLGQPVSARKWRTLMLLVLGVYFISAESAPPADTASTAARQSIVSFEYLLGVFYASLQTLGSGLGSIWFERILKSKDGALVREFSVWDRNVQLAVISILLYLPISVYETGGYVFAGFSPVVWLIAVLHAAGGILVALSVFYTSSVTKTVAVCGSVVLTTVVSHILFDAPLTPYIACGCLIVVVCIFQYKDDCALDAVLPPPASSPKHEALT